MSATHVLDSTPTSAPKLYLAFDLGWTSWSLAFTTGMAQKPRLKTISARDLDALKREINSPKLASACLMRRRCSRATRPVAMAFGSIVISLTMTSETSSLMPLRSRSTVVPDALNRMPSTLLNF